MLLVRSKALTGQVLLPAERGAARDAKGRPALAADCTAPTLLWSKPLGDPFGGTTLANGRHPVKMFEPKAAEDAPKEVVYLILGSLQFSEAALRVYGHPQLLAVAAAINGPDFTPFNEALFIKEPGLGASVAWHQDGVTHWDSPTLDGFTHGFNFMAQLYGCTAANGVSRGSRRLAARKHSRHAAQSAALEQQDRTHKLMTDQANREADVQAKMIGNQFEATNMKMAAATDALSVHRQMTEAHINAAERVHNLKTQAATTHLDMTDRVHKTAHDQHQRAAKTEEAKAKAKRAKKEPSGGGNG